MAIKRKSGPRHLRLAPQWDPPAFIGQSGLWLRDPADDSYIECSPEDAGLSEELGDRIESWMDEFDSLFDPDDPAASRFSSHGAHQAWLSEGMAIAALIRAALGPDGTLDVVMPDDLEPLS